MWVAMCLHFTGLRKLLVLKDQLCLWSPQQIEPEILEKMLKTKGLSILADKVGLLGLSKGKIFHFER